MRNGKGRRRRGEQVFLQKEVLKVWVDPFWVGVAFTVIVEFAILLAVSLFNTKKK